MKLLNCGGTVQFDHNSYHRHLDGLQKLSFGLDYEEEPYNGDDVIHLLLEHHRSLDHIVVIGNITDAGALWHGHHINSSCEFGRLEQIEISACDEEAFTLTTFIISRSPHLQHISMDLYAANNDGICNAVKRLPNLRKITARQITPDSPSFETLLLHHAQLAMKSSLKELEITFRMNASHLPWVAAVAGLENLEKLVLSTAPTNNPSTFVSILGMLGKGCPSLEYLYLDCFRSTIPDGAIAQMKHHPTLKRLHVRASTISDSDIISLLSFTNLKHVVIVSTLKDYLFDLLKKHIAHVEQRRW
ncbi:hypothetical protein O0I10_006310 [Lichtheimia ornata]|uniref:Uncharacterized protein n=1 Tax=Lichtheimia ornata TaxID=688661 RepID=A0AAD7XUZ2_9FUNG|nr:uncharacterized protein O0I10_006310 [Lichtheimia ornata]KAJ8658039.1 hypothetical protein O0I10_006310 [Lichtheimia ornata]